MKELGANEMDFRPLGSWEKWKVLEFLLLQISVRWEEVANSISASFVAGYAV